MSPKAILFDAYGTLFDVHSVIVNAAADLSGDLSALSQLWRRTQLELTWRYALMERYQDFFVLTERALRLSLYDLSIPATEAQIEKLTHSYFTPNVFPDVRQALDEPGARPLGILSNGSPAMLAAAVRTAGLESRLTHVISADSVRTYKPSPRVYALGPAALNLAPAEILFVSSNLWDAEGARAFGYSVCWCNREPVQSALILFAPNLTVTALDQIPRLLTT